MRLQQVGVCVCVCIYTYVEQLPKSVRFTRWPRDHAIQVQFDAVGRVEIRSSSPFQIGDRSMTHGIDQRHKSAETIFFQHPLVNIQKAIENGDL